METRILKLDFQDPDLMLHVGNVRVAVFYREDKTFIAMEGGNKIEVYAGTIPEDILRLALNESLNKTGTIH